MIPVAQLIDSPDNGDCFRACVASILEVDPLTLPNISEAEYKDRYWLDVMNDAIAKFGLAIMYTSSGQCFWDLPYFIWSVQSPRFEGKTHAVVASCEEGPGHKVHGWRIAWDPSPWRDYEPEKRAECYDKPLAAYFFVATDPSAMVRSVTGKAG